VLSLVGVVTIMSSKMTGAVVSVNGSL